MSNKISKIKLRDNEIYEINALYFNGMTEDQLIAKISPIIQSDSVQYLGLISSVNNLSTSASKGDFYRASVAFDIAHAGDLIIALVDNPIKDLTEDFTVEAGWAVVHGGEFDMNHTHSYSGNAAVTFEDAPIALTGTATGTVAISKGTGTANYTPAGSVGLTLTPTPTGGASGDGISLEHSHTYEKATSATISVGSGTANYTPAGTVSKPSFTGSDGTTGSALADDTSFEVSVDCGTHTHTASFSGSNYTPEGEVSVTVTTENTGENSGDGVTAVTGIAAGSLTSGTANGTGKIKYVESVTHSVPTTQTTAAAPNEHTHTVTVQGTTGNNSGTAVVAVTGITPGSLTSGSASGTGKIQYLESLSGGSASFTSDSTSTNGYKYLEDVTHTAATLTGSTTFATAGVTASVSGEVLTLAAAGTGTVGISGGSISKTTKYFHHNYTAPTATKKYLTYVSAEASGTGNAAPHPHTHSYGSSSALTTGANSGNAVSAITSVTHAVPTVSTKYLTYTSASASGTDVVAPNGHTHSYTKATGAGGFTGTPKAVAGSVTVNNTKVTGTGSGTLDLAHTHSFKPAGSVSQPTFTGTGKQLVVTLDHATTNTNSVLSGTAAAQSHTHNYDKATSASFTGTGVELKAVFTGSSHTVTGTYKKVATVSYSGTTGTPE